MLANLLFHHQHQNENTNTQRERSRRERKEENERDRLFKGLALTKELAEGEESGSTETGSSDADMVGDSSLRVLGEH